MKLKPIYRITTFVPSLHLEGLVSGISKHAAGIGGHYDQALWWSAPGTEQFRPLANAKPAVGKADQIERVPSIQVVFSIPKDRSLLDKVLKDGLIANHPWEEPVIYVEETVACIK